jgi:uncharacterized protein YdbL (DUF1318 family)
MSLGLRLGLQYSKLSGNGSGYNAFIIEVKTDNAGFSNNNQFQFTGALGDYDVVAKQNDIVVATFNDLSGQQTITLPSSGVYVLEVNAKEVNGFTGIRFNNNGDRLKVLKINQWGVFNDNRTANFFGCKNLIQIADDNDWLNSITNGSNIFNDSKLTTLPSSLNLQNLVIGKYMFIYADLTELPDVMILNNLENGQGMFLGNNLTDLPVEMKLPNFKGGNNFLRFMTINTTRYSQLLVDMQNLNSNRNVSFHSGNSQYNAQGETARNLLINNQNWTFTDGGQV